MYFGCFSMKPIAKTEANPTNIALIMSGVLPLSSATYGAMIVKVLDIQLQIPKTVDAKSVGIN